MISPNLAWWAEYPFAPPLEPNSDLVLHRLISPNSTMANHPVPPLNGTRLKTTLKMAISKLKFLQEKKTAISKQQRRQLADYLSAGKELSAKIRVENIIREDINIELLEHCELYCELLLARAPIITDPQRHTVDPGLKEAILSVVFLSHHTELRELNTLTDLFRQKYGPEFIQRVLENENGDYVPEKIVKKCSIEAPSEVLVELYLTEIARAYEVPYSGLKDEFDDDGGSGGIGETVSQPVKEAPIAANDAPLSSEAPKVEPAKPAASDFDSLKARFSALKR